MILCPASQGVFVLQVMTSMKKSCPEGATSSAFAQMPSLAPSGCSCSCQEPLQERRHQCPWALAALWQGSAQEGLGEALCDPWPCVTGSFVTRWPSPRGWGGAGCPKALCDTL